jgi:hypothetical protein
MYDSIQQSAYDAYDESLYNSLPPITEEDTAGSNVAAEGQEKLVVKVVEGRAVGIATDDAVSDNADEVAVTNNVAVGRGAHRKRYSSHIDEVAVTSNIAVGRGARGKRNSSHIDEVAVTNTPTSNHGRSLEEGFLRTLVTNNDSVFEEEQVCWLCGGTPCDWLEYLTDLLEEINNKFPTDVNGNRIDASSHEVVPMNQIRYTLYRAFTYAQYGHLGKNNCIKLGKCVEGKIKELFPHPDGEEYTGFLPADEHVIE